MLLIILSQRLPGLHEYVMDMRCIQQWRDIYYQSRNATQVLGSITALRDRAADKSGDTSIYELNFRLRIIAESVVS